MGKSSKWTSAVALALLGLAGGCAAGASEEAPGDALEGVETDTDEAPLTVQCPAPPEGTPAQAVRAFERLNRRRTAAGLECLEYSPQIADAARKHCEYYTSNRGRCTAKPHNEVAGCDKFTGERFSDRLRAAKYDGQPAYEVMAYVAQGDRAVDMWIDSVWHRVPFFSPRVKHVGYGTAGACDTMDFGYGTAPGTFVKPIFYPFDKQTGVLTKFEGRENPEPPRPPKGWPSGYPVTLYSPGVVIESHVIKVDGTEANLPHVFLSPDDPRSLGLLYDEFMLYTHDPLQKKTTYRVILDGHNKKTGSKVHYEWTFTTK